MEEIDITWFPNSWVRIRSRDKVVYFDPAYLTTYFSGYNDKTEFSKWPDPIDGLPNGLEKGDFIFITHHHKDQCKKVTVDRLRKDSTIILAPSSCKNELKDLFREVKPGDKIRLDNKTTLKVFHAYNMESGSSTRKQHKKGKGVGYLLTINDWTIYHAGDTDLIPEMSALGGMDVALIPMGGKFTMEIDEAIETTLMLNPGLVIPIHHLKKNPQDFCTGLKNRTNIRCIIPRIGEPIKLGLHE